MAVRRLSMLPRSPEWFAFRARYLTASQVPAAAGLDPYMTALELYLEKTGVVVTDADNTMTRRGRHMESVGISLLMEENPDWEIRYPLNMVFADDALGLSATPDAVGITDQPGLTNIQIKVVAKPEFERRWNGRPPEGVEIQTLTEAMLMDVQQSLVVAVVVDAYSLDIHSFPVPRHEAAEARVKAIAAEFHDNLRTGRRPPADYGRDAKTLAKLYPVSVPEPVLDLTGDNRLPDRLARRFELKQVIDVAQTEVDDIDTEIRDKLGEAERAVVPGWKLTLKTEHRKERMVAATSFRRLRVTKEKAA